MADTPQRPYIGGQAVIEGVMMRSPKSFVTAVRTPEGGVAVRELAWETLWPKLKFLRWPIFRGAVVLAESLHNGFTALQFSADYGMPEDQGGKRRTVGVSALLAFLMAAIVSGADSDPTPPIPPPSVPKKQTSTAFLAIATAMMMGFFIALPHLLTWGVGRLVGPAMDTQGFLFHIVDGAFRVVILVGYVWILSKTKDAARLFRYHGAEHKAIWTYESEKPLTVDAARPFTTRHPRCGTSFLFIVVGVSVLVHLLTLPFIGKMSDNVLINNLLLVLIKLPMAFPIAGIAYELQRISARPNAPKLITLMMRPGIWLQGITTQPPTDAQQEMALLSLDRALAREQGKPKGDEGISVYPSFEQAVTGAQPA
jgi:uncharacterized protein YqhQ